MLTKTKTTKNATATTITTVEMKNIILLVITIQTKMQTKKAGK